MCSLIRRAGWSFANPTYSRENDLISYSFIAYVRIIIWPNRALVTIVLEPP